MLVRSLGIAALLAAPLLISPFALPRAAAQSGAPPPATTAPGAARISGAPGAAATPRGETVEQRIATLHRQLKITSDQENDWNAVAQAMRDNANSMQQLLDQTRQGAQATALDNLDSYQKFAQAHADGVKNLIGPFTTLYNEMTPEQKKNADQVFNNARGQPTARRATKPSG